MMKAKKKQDAFVKVPLWWITEATKATRTPMTMVAIELLYAAWKARNMTIPIPNGRLAKLGVSREIKRRALQKLEAAGLIQVERQSRKTPKVTLVVL
jgi:hypothetical protein